MTAIDEQEAAGQRAVVSWGVGGTPVSEVFGDPYFSLVGGLEETRYVFLDGNGLPGRLRPGFSVAELGFGTGLNLLALAAATPPGCAIRYTSFEAYPMRGDEVARALGAIDDPAITGEGIARIASALDSRATAFQLGEVEVRLVWGDVRQTLPRWPGRADAWFLDGFAPAKNPEMWEPSLMAEVARHTAPRGTFATYTAAGAVRRALTDAGFAVLRTPGFGTKRHMSQGRLEASA